MKRGRWWRLFTSVLFAAAGVAMAADARADVQKSPPSREPLEVQAEPGAHVIVDDYLRGATPEDAAPALRFCEAIPGCSALWQQDVGTILILRPVPVDTGDVGGPEMPPITAPSSN
jgi:hypothetical protein